MSSKFPPEKLFYKELQKTLNKNQLNNNDNTLDAELDALLKKSQSKSKAITLDEFEEYAERRAKAAAEAEAQEAINRSNIHNYEFDRKRLKPKAIVFSNGARIKIKQKLVQIKAVIDFLDLKFEVERNTTRSRIKELITKKTGTKHYIKDDDSDIREDGNSFTIRLHDVSSRKDLFKITELLGKYYGADLGKMTIIGIELSLDFYRAENNGLLSALHKSNRYRETSENFRIYKYKRMDQRNKFTPIPHDPLTLLDLINNDWCLGINPKGSPLYYRLYHKTTDKNGQPLPTEQHRLRIEVNLNGEGLNGINCHIDNLRNIIKYGFKQLTFTKLSKKTTEEDKKDYRESIKPFGKELKKYSSISHRDKSLADAIEAYAELNRIVSKAIHNLERNF